MLARRFLRGMAASCLISGAHRGSQEVVSAKPSGSIGNFFTVAKVRLIPVVSFSSRETSEA